MKTNGNQFLCVCQYGHSRSVALTRVLHSKGLQAVACGWQTAGHSALPVLCRWASDILILDDSYLQYIEEEYHSKVTAIHVGPDKWSNPYNQNLLNLLYKLVDEKLGIK